MILPYAKGSAIAGSRSVQSAAEYLIQGNLLYAVFDDIVDA